MMRRDKVSGPAKQSLQAVVSFVGVAKGFGAVVDRSCIDLSWVVVERMPERLLAATCGAYGC